MAVASSAPAEDRLVRERCGLLDRSERGKLSFSGTEAAEYLNGQVTNDLLALAPGQGCYAALLTPKGKMLADLRVLRPHAEPDTLWLDTERCALQDVFDTLRRHLVGFQVELHKRTLQQGLISLVGPDARSVAGAENLPSAEHANAPAALAGAAVTLIATDLGVDVLCESADLEAVRSALEDRGATAVPEAAVELLRIERGRPRYGLDLDQATIPQEAGLNERAVSFTKGCYVGQETVARLYYRGRPNRNLRGLRLSAPAASGANLLLGERVVGRVGSVAVSPRLGPIALALVRREANPGDTLRVGDSDVSAQVVELPFPAC